MCGSRRGHFVRCEDAQGVWVRWSDVEFFVMKATEELRIVEREIGVPSEALKLLGLPDPPPETTTPG